MGFIQKYLWIAVLLFLAASYAVIDYQLKNRVILQSFRELEQAEAQKDLNRCLDALHREIHHLHGLATDWAVWDDSFRFAKDRNEKYIESNLQMETLESNGSINLIYFLTPEGKVIWGKGFSKALGGEVFVFDIAGRPIDFVYKALGYHDDITEKSGILITNYGLMLLVSTPILDSMGNGPSPGDLIMGRFVTDTMLETLADQTKVSFGLKIVGKDDLTDLERASLDRLELEPHVIVESGPQLMAFALIRDVFGHPSVLVSAGLPRSIMDKGKKAAWIVSVSLLISFVMCSGFLLFMVKSYIGEEKRRTSFVEALVNKRTLELKQANENLEKARQGAVEASQAKSEFVANMSHEIRTPLNGIIGMAEIAMTTIENERQRDIFETINRESHALLGIINTILDFSKIEARKIEVEQITFDMWLFMDDLGKSIAFQAEQKGLSFDLVRTPDVPRYVEGDPGRIRQIILNLAGNALKFTQRGGLLLDCSLEHKSEDRCLIRFSVIDTGIGIDEKNLDRIFESFTQADGSTTRRFGGTGLGISISKKLAELMGGDMGVESWLGKGSTFWFTVMVNRKDGHEHGRINVYNGDQDISVLVVGGRAGSSLPFLGQLKELGYRTEEWVQGKDALARLKLTESSKVVHLIMIDDNLADTDGFTLAKEIRAMEHLNHIPVILTTRTGNPGDGKACVENGISGYITGAVDSYVLNQIIGHVMANGKPVTEQGHGELVTRHTITERAGVKPRVLLVEDYPTNRQVALNFLQLSGFEVDVAENGQECVEIVREKQYDVILMDVQMPVMDGYAATREIRRMEEILGQEHRPIIAMTANVMKEDRAKCLASGMDDVITKPVTRGSLAKAISRWIDPGPASGDKPSNRQEAPEDTPCHLDYERALDEFMGAEDVLLSTLTYFLNHGREQIKTINDALAQRTGNVVAEEAHKLKGGAANVTMDVLAQAASELEQAGKTGEYDRAGSLVETISREFNRLETFLVKNITSG